MLTIREGRPEDTPGLVTLRTAWAAEQEPALKDDPAFDSTFREWMDTSPRKFFVADDDGEPVGMLNLMIFERMPKPGRESSRWVYLGNMYVLPEFRNSGTPESAASSSTRRSSSQRASKPFGWFFPPPPNHATFTHGWDLSRPGN